MIRPSQTQTIWCVIPALNEERAIGRVIRDFGAAVGRPCQCIVIDDGSTDRTSRAARGAATAQIGVTILRHDSALGPGSSFAEGFRYLTGRVGERDIVFCLEGDGTSDLTIVPRMLAQIELGDDLVLASVYAYGGAIIDAPPWRRVLSHGANGFGKAALGLSGLHTVTSFYRALSSGGFDRLQATYGSGIMELSGFECMVEMTMKATLLNLRISEVPTVLDTSSRDGRSRMRVTRTLRGYVQAYRRQRAWAIIAAKGSMGNVDKSVM